MKLRKNSGSKKREKSLEISRFSAVWLAKRLFSSCGSILTTQHGRGRRIRTRDPRFWRPVLYQLSYTPVQRQYYSTHPAKKQGVSRKIRKLFCVQIAQQEPEAGDRQRKVFRKIRAAYPVHRVGGCPLAEQPTSHTTVRTVRYTAVQS